MTGNGCRPFASQYTEKITMPLCNPPTRKFKRTLPSLTLLSGQRVNKPNLLLMFRRMTGAYSPPAGRYRPPK